MRRTGNDINFMFGVQVGSSAAIQFQHLFVITADNEQSRCTYIRQTVARHVGTATARNDGSDIVCIVMMDSSGGNQRRGSAGAGAEQADLQMPQFGLGAHPAYCVGEPRRQQVDVEHVWPMGRLIIRQQVE